MCRPTGNCDPGIHAEDPVKTPWSCRNVTTAPASTTTTTTTTAAALLAVAPQQSASKRSAAGSGASCAAPWSDCLRSQCCSEGHTCYEKDSSYAQCRPTGNCTSGVQPDDPNPTHWSCCVLPGDCPVTPGCSPSWGGCTESRCCTTGFTCYEKDSYYAMCRPDGNCASGIHEEDPIKTPWSCRNVTSPPASTTTTTTTTAPRLLSAAPQQNASQAGGAASGTHCAMPWSDCLQSQCCTEGHKCYEKDSSYAQCRPMGMCTPGVQKDDPHPTHWSCCVLPGDCPVTPGCSPTWGACTESRCCPAGFTCYEKNSDYSMCRPNGNCAPGIHKEDPIKTPWSCQNVTAAPATTTTTTTMAACMDGNVHCPAWAQIGECEKNPTFMLSVCSLSCGVCR